MLIDTHAHIDMQNYLQNFDEVLSAAKLNSVEKIIIPGVEPSGYERIIELVEKYDELYGALGVHPGDSNTFNDETVSKLLKFGLNKKIVAIGEIGLDYYWDKSFVNLQKEVFTKQIEIAKELKKPVIIHDRDAHFDSFQILKSTGASEVGVVMHCFSGAVEFAKRCIDEGFYIALGGVVTFKNAKKIKEVAKYVPLDRLLLETDSPYLTPEPYRGKENRPAYVKYVAMEIANLKDVPFELVAQKTTENAVRVFNLDKVENG